MVSLVAPDPLSWVPVLLSVNVTKDILVNIVIPVHLDTLEIHIKSEAHVRRVNVMAESIQLILMHVMQLLENV